MRILETNIPDIQDLPLDQAKLALADRVSQTIAPVIDQLYVKQKDNLSGLKKKFDENKEKITETKNLISTLTVQNRKKEKIKKLLSRLSRIISSNSLQTNQAKKETIILLKIIDRLPEDKIDLKLQETLRLIGQSMNSR